MGSSATNEAPFMSRELLASLAAGREDRVRHIEDVPAREPRFAEWPEWVDPTVCAALTGLGIQRPWLHQAAAASLAHDGAHTVIAAGTASGKTAAYWMPTLSAICERDATVLYLSPTKALANDQLNSLLALDIPGVRPATYDGDTSQDDRSWARKHANYLLTNPDMLHHGILPMHATWASYFRRLSFIVIDEVHIYRGVFGSHVAALLRRLQRVAERYGAHPIVIAASATAAEPGVSVSRLIGAPVAVVDDDASGRGAMTFALWEPIENPETGVRRSATAETADLLTDLVCADRQTIAFVRSRRGAEAIALTTKDLVSDVDPALVSRVAAYRGGYLPEERRELEAQLRARAIIGMAATNALELGIDISGVDAVLGCGWPGTRASLWQQVGRAGRGAQDALAVFVARDDPLDTYVATHPESVFGRPVEASVFDPSNPYVLGPHLCAAASEIPISEHELEQWGWPQSLLDDLVAQGLLRKRPTGWYWTQRERAHDLVEIRGGIGGPTRVVEADTGRMLGTVDAGATHASVHPGAIYLHQGATFVITELDLDDQVALAEAVEVDYTTLASDVNSISIIDVDATRRFGNTVLSFGTVEVRSQVVSFGRRRILTGEYLGEVGLDLPVRTLITKAVWWTADGELIDDAGLDAMSVPGAAHAAEHASIGLLPLFATCDRWDIGGVSTDVHQDTGVCTVFVYDGYPGGAGFAEYGFTHAEQWLGATRDLIASCECLWGCPSCVQSPKCGNGNEPLDKSGALRLLNSVLGPG